MVYLLFNPKANSGQTGCARKEAAEHFADQQLKLIDVIGLDYRAFVTSLEPEDEIVLLGGDGTIHYFIEAVEGIELKNRVSIYKAGTGNDFLRDVLGNTDTPDGTIVAINDYIQNLPKVSIDGKTCPFINNVAFGVDGQVVTKAEEAKEQGETKINYTSLAIKCLLRYFHPSNVTVTVDDGEPQHFRKVWLATTMNGRFYGGGMMLAPEQDRQSDKVTCVVFHGTGKLRTLMIFPKIFTGEHVKYEKNITVLEGHKIKIESDRPQDVQIEGELVRDVTTYTVEKAPFPVTEPEPSAEEPAEAEASYAD